MVCYGDIDFVRQVNQRSKFIPGAYCNFGNMKCSIYYAYFGEHLLNRDYTMIPVGDLLRRWDILTIAPGSFPPFHRSLFVRPNSGAKPFTGYVVSSDDKHKIELLERAIGPETLVLISPSKEITAEWRFVICNRKVIAGCQYLPTESPSYPPTSFRLAEKIGQNEWQPDICYTVDIAESNGKMYLLEINSFSCAGLYDCDLKSIVSHISDAAKKEWDEYF